MASTNGQFARDILNNKLLFERLLQDHIPIPKVLALVERGEVSTITANATIKDAERLLEYASAWG